MRSRCGFDVESHELFEFEALDQALPTSLSRYLATADANDLIAATESFLTVDDTRTALIIFVSSPALRTDEDATATSLIDLVIAVQTEQL